MSDLPEGWALANIPDMVTHVGLFCDGDWVESKDQDPDGDVRLIQLADVGDGAYRDRSARFLTSSRAQELGCTFLQPGDVLIARMPDPLGRACLFPGDSKASVTVVDVCVVRPSAGGVSPRWLMYTVNAPQARRAMVPFEMGTTRKRISRKNLARIPLPVPPLAEQERIIAAVEGQFSRLDAGQAALDRVRHNLKRMRSALLRTLVADRVGWPTRFLSDVVTIASGQTPKELTLEPSGDVPFYKVGDMNLADGAVMKGARGYVSVAQAAKLGLHVRPAGTVIFPKRGGAIATNKKRLLSRPAAYDLNTMGLVPGDDLLPEYLLLWLSTIDLSDLADGSNVPQINHGDLALLKLPIPPIADQEFLVTEASRSLDAIIRAEASVLSNDSRASRLRSTILNAAFSGRLVPQDSNDEPASVLLERIGAERTSSNGHNATRVRKPRDANRKVPA